MRAIERDEFELSRCNDTAERSRRLARLAQVCRHFARRRTTPHRTQLYARTYALRTEAQLKYNGLPSTTSSDAADERSGKRRRRADAQPLHQSLGNAHARSLAAALDVPLRYTSVGNALERLARVLARHAERCAVELNEPLLVTPRARADAAAAANAEQERSASAPERRGPAAFSFRRSAGSAFDAPGAPTPVLSSGLQAVLDDRLNPSQP